MRKFTHLLAFVLYCGTGLLGPAVCLARSGGDQERVVELTADKDNRFKLSGGKQSALVLKAGETVKFRIMAYFGGEKARDGSVHSFVVRSLRDAGWDVRLKEGLNEFTLVAPGAGDYLVECTVKCGPGHDSMSMKMQVR
jgi:heme/copper-type cytochrome/quinol oxidase subunit 2